MKYSLAVLALAAGVFADSWGNSTGVAYETITTTALTTYCPQATTLVHGSSTYTVTEATTLTITDVCIEAILLHRAMLTRANSAHAQ